MVDSKDPQLGVVDFFKPDSTDLPTKRVTPLPTAITKPLFPLTDLGNAQRLVAWYGDALRYVPEWGTYLIFEDGYWKQDKAGVRVLTRAMHVARAIAKEARLATTPALQKQLKAWSKKSEGGRSIRTMVDLARGMPGLLLDHAELDKDAWLLQCGNGTVNLRTGKIVPLAAGSYVTKTTGVAYDPAAKAPLWQKFLETILPNPDVRAFVQRLAGYCLTGDVSERVLVLMHGLGRNGKSLMLHVLQSAMGAYATTTMPTLLMAKKTEGHSAEVAHLFGARLAVTSEVKKGQAFDEEKVKRLTGNDIITARGMRQDPWSFEPTFKLVVLMNHKPQVRDSSDSIWDRIVLVPFDVRIKDADVDRGLFDKLKAELPGVLAWAVEGCLAWQKGGLAIPDAVKAVTKEYRREEDIIGRFVDDCCSLHPLQTVSAANLATAANEWTKVQSLFTFNSKAVAERLKELGCTEYRTGKGRYWRGISLTSEKKEPEKAAVRLSKDSSRIGDVLRNVILIENHPKKPDPK